MKHYCNATDGNTEVVGEETYPSADSSTTCRAQKNYEAQW